MKKFVTGITPLIILAVAGLFTFIKLYDKVSPQASIDIKLSKSEASVVAQNFLKQQNLSTTDYKTVTIFSSDEEAVVFLEKTQGAEKANQLMKSEVPVWFWDFRAFKPLQKEEFEVLVNPTSGVVVSFLHIMDDDKEGANLRQEEAQSMAENFIKTVAKVDLDNYERVEASSEKKKNRTDHNFEWKQKNHQIGDSEFRLAVDVQGDSVGFYKNYLKVPDQFSRDFQKESSMGDLLTMISIGLMILLAIAAFAVFIQKYKKGDIRWKFSLVFALVILALSILNTINSIPILKSNYSTETGYSVFFGVIIVATVIGSVVYGIFILLTGAAGDSLTRENFPQSISSLNQLIKGNIFKRNFLLSSILGYLLAFIFLGYTSVFYFIATEYFGVWSLPESPFDNMLNTSLPFLYPLLIGVTAAVSEEFIFRFFAISFFKKYLKYTFVAVLIPSIIWAFAHSNYPVFPVYIRGIELTIGGLLFSYFFIRYGLWTCIVAHFVLDALLVSMPLLRSENSYYIVSGSIVVSLALIPVLLSFFGFRKERKLKN